MTWYLVGIVVSFILGTILTEWADIEDDHFIVVLVTTLLWPVVVPTMVAFALLTGFVLVVQKAHKGLVQLTRRFL